MRVEKWHIPEELYYDKSDFWIKVTDKQAVIGMTDYGQSNTGDILYLELVPAGTVITRGERFGSIESGKWVGNMSAPVSGVVLESNCQAEVDPRLVNADSFGRGWLCRVELADPAEIKLLMEASAYKIWIEKEIGLKKEDEVAI